MPLSPAVTIRLLTAAHVQAALRLSNEAGWNQREEDWRVAIGMTPGASFCAMAEGGLVGTCIGIGYGEFGWIAMMLVDPAFQRQGLGAGLLLGAINALPPDRPIGLDATAVGRLLYDQHGFRDTCKLTRWIADDVKFVEHARARAIAGAVATIRPIEPDDLTLIASADSRCSAATGDGCSSGRGLPGRIAARLRPSTPNWQDTCSGEVAACSTTWAPWSPDRSRLRERSFDTSRGRRLVPIGIDAFDADPSWNEWLAASGFVRQRPLARMMRPPAAEDSKGRRVAETQRRRVEESALRAFSIFGPEFA